MDFLLAGLIKAFQLLVGGDPETYSAIWVTVRLSTLSMAVTMAIGVPLGFSLGYFTFPGKRAVRLITDTLLSFPTVVIGLLVYAMVTRRGPLGDFGLLFSIPGMAIGQTILGLPIVVAFTAQTVEAMDRRLAKTLLTLGASPVQLALSTCYEARYGIMLAAVTAYGRIVSEVGISMMVGGNIKWYTRTITTAIALETGKGQFAMGIALGLVLLLIAFAVNALLATLKRRAGT